MSLDLADVRNKLNSGEITPTDVDLSEIKSLSAMIPSSGVIDLNMAEELATQFIRAADICVEIHSIAMMYEGRMIAQKRKVWALAMYKKAKEANLNTAKEKEAFADADEEYLQWNDRAVDAMAFRKWLENKLEVFIKAHHLARSVYEAGKRQEPMGSRVERASEKSDYFGKENW